MLKEGYSCENAFIPYTPTVTAIGHTTVYTGSVPAFHGIAGNAWFDRRTKRSVYCTEDSSVQTVGSTGAAGKMSPRNLWSTTISDELKLAQNFRNKTIAIALKDRGGILPGGHTADAVYWFDNTSRGWISSTYYLKSLPKWMEDFNSRKLPEAYIKQGWNLLYEASTYKQSSADSVPWESKLEDQSFPHVISGMPNPYESFRYTPSATTYTFETAKAAIDGEKLGTTGFTDFLALSLSSPDYAGHSFGPNSVEIEDTYLKLDRDIANFLSYLDKKLGKGQYLVFLTADHGVAQVPGYLKTKKIPTGVFDEVSMRTILSDSIRKRFGVNNSISAISNYQIYLNDTGIIARGVKLDEVKSYIIRLFTRHEAVSQVIDLLNLGSVPVAEPLRTMLINGYNQKFSGDLLIVFKPQWFETWRTGATHGSWNPYDSHIPLLWFGWNVKPGKLYRKVYMTDIAPTLSSMLKIQMPNANVGSAITELIK